MNFNIVYFGYWAVYLYWFQHRESQINEGINLGGQNEKPGLN